MKWAASAHAVAAAAVAFLVDVKAMLGTGFEASCDGADTFTTSPVCANCTVLRWCYPRVGCDCCGGGGACGVAGTTCQRG